MKINNKIIKLSCLVILFPACFVDVYASCVEQYDREKPDHLYQDNDNGTVTDIETGLTWQKCPVGMLWQQAAPVDYTDDSCSGTPMLVNWADSLTQASIAVPIGVFSNWRLPNKKELSSLMDVSCQSPAINTAHFPLVPNSSGLKLWTSTVKTNSNAYAWGITYNTGFDAPIGKTALKAVYLVHD